MAEPVFDYPTLTRDALLGVVRQLLDTVAASGLPGEHHFYLAFETTHPGVEMSSRLRALYPEEMTIVLQHQFWGLAVDDQGFEVRLSFSGIQERLRVPYAALKMFFDPSVPYLMPLDGGEAIAEALEHAGISDDDGPSGSDKGADTQPAQPPATGQVVDLASFRKRPN